MVRFLVLRATAVLALALVFAPAASAHGGGGAAAGYRSTVTGLNPPVLGVLVAVLNSDDRLRVVNYSDKTIVVSGYDGEPFLRFAKDGVYENARSPATYLSRERDPAKATVPASADSSAPPRWRRIAAAAESVVWHDHRIHWVKRQPPPVVANDPTGPKLVFRWRIPGTADGKPFAITGFLGYTPPPQAAAEQGGAGTSPWLIAAVAVTSGLVLAGLAVGARRTRRRAPA